MRKNAETGKSVSRCMMCGKNLQEDRSLRRVFLEEDPLCSQCRNSWQKESRSFRIQGIRADASWRYTPAFSKCLIQYKECGDEALKDAFLYPQCRRLQRIYRGYVIFLMPSSLKKQESRGFCHLAGIFECLNLPMVQAFEKTDQEEQKTQNRAGRIRMRHGIRLKPDLILPNKILLADDVITTGSTMMGALACLDPQKSRIRIYSVSAHESWFERDTG